MVSLCQIPYMSSSDDELKLLNKRSMQAEAPTILPQQAAGGPPK